jgi:hypothetical protein
MVYGDARRGEERGGFEAEKKDARGGYKRGGD